MRMACASVICVALPLVVYCCYEGSTGQGARAASVPDEGLIPRVEKLMEDVRKLRDEAMIYSDHQVVTIVMRNQVDPPKTALPMPDGLILKFANGTPDWGTTWSAHLTRDKIECAPRVTNGKPESGVQELPKDVAERLLGHWKRIVDEKQLIKDCWCEISGPGLYQVAMLERLDAVRDQDGKGVTLFVTRGGPAAGGEFKPWEIEIRLHLWLRRAQ